MSKILPKQLIEDLASEIYLSPSNVREKIEHVPVSFWMPESVHAKYKKLQDATSNQFGKALKQALIKAIENAPGEEPAA